MKKVFKFKKVEYFLSSGYEHKASEAYICCKGIHYYFGFPEYTKTIWLIISDKSLGKNSYKIIFEGGEIKCIDAEVPYQEELESDFSQLMGNHNLLHRELWIKVEY